MNPARVKALRLRIEGRSYNEIQKEVGVAKSTLSLWLRDVVLSEAALKRLESRLRQGVTNGFVKRNKLQTHVARQRMIATRQRARALVPKLSRDDLMLAGALLYWAEGYKRLRVRNGKEITSHVISFVNSDPEMITLFVCFLKEILNISPKNIRLCMRLYPHINEKEAGSYWSKIVGLTKENFIASTYLVTGASKGVRPHNRLPYGTLQVAVNDTNRFHHLMGLVEGVKERFLYDIIRTLPG